MQNPKSLEENLCVYLNETWIFFNKTTQRFWQDKDVRSAKRVSLDRSNFSILNVFTIIILLYFFIHIDMLLHTRKANMVFIKNASLIFKCQKILEITIQK